MGPGEERLAAGFPDDVTVGFEEMQVDTRLPELVVSGLGTR